MAQPNLTQADITGVNRSTEHLTPTTSFANWVAPPATGHMKEVTSLLIHNKHATAIGYITVVFVDPSTSPPTEYDLATAKPIQAKTMVNLLLGNAFPLKEGEYIQAKCNTGNTFELYAPRTDVTDV